MQEIWGPNGRATQENSRATEDIIQLVRRAVALNPDSEAPKDASVLSKPFHLKDLVSEVERLLAA